MLLHVGAGTLAAQPRPERLDGSDVREEPRPVVGSRFARRGQIGAVRRYDELVTLPGAHLKAGISAPDAAHELLVRRHHLDAPAAIDELRKARSAGAPRAH